MTMTQLAIRRAAVTDAEDIAATHVRAWRQAYADIMPGAALESFTVEKRATAWAQILADSDTFVAEQGNSIVGFCSVGPVRDADLDDSRVGELYALYVEPSLWRSGIGSSLCSAGLAHLRDKNLVRATLWVLADNSLGRRFYEKFGFAADGHSEPYVAGDAELMELRYTMSL